MPCRRFGRLLLLLFVDNASYHKSVKVGNELDGMGGHAVPGYFPPYTPEPSPAGAGGA